MFASRTRPRVEGPVVILESENFVQRDGLQPIFRLDHLPLNSVPDSLSSRDTIFRTERTSKTYSAAVPEVLPVDNTPMFTRHGSTTHPHPSATHLLSNSNDR
jgi:hypothetical protein